jgi:hypothetical protein
MSGPIASLLTQILPPLSRAFHPKQNKIKNPTQRRSEAQRRPGIWPQVVLSAGFCLGEPRRRWSIGKSVVFGSSMMDVGEGA